MDDFEKNRRFWQVMAGLFLLVVGLAMFGGSGSMFPMLLAASGFYLLARQVDRSHRAMGSAPEAEDYSPPVESPARQTSGAEQVYAHALAAVERAGRDPGDTHVLPVDIGVMTFRAGIEPTIHRSQPVYDDVDYIQPFVQLRLPRRATGRIRFEIVDSDGQVLFVHEDYHQLERGRNLVTPSSRLPIHDAQAMHRDWDLRVSADGVLLASHTFGWRERTEKVVRRYMREDGEITSELRAAVLDNEPGSISLDDLLADQSDEPQRQAGRR
jgi:hypothetical protein